MDRSDIIAQRRREQPLAELARKARKAGRASQEATDLTFARNHADLMAHRTRWLADNGHEKTRCFYCWALGSDWDDGAKAYRTPPQHKPGCYFGPHVPRVYSGTTYTGAKAGPAGVLP